MPSTNRFSVRRPNSKACRPPGFALVTTLALMILLTVIAVGLLTLSSISLRSSGRGEAMAMARTNARLGLMLAIGELQKQLGPDPRISAVSAILDTSSSTSSASTAMKHPHLTGVWTSRQEALGATPDYDPKKTFQQWLVSSSKPDDLLNADFAKSGVFDDPVMMVGARGTGTGNEATYAGKIPVPTSNPGMQGDVAWWVADENSKGFTNPVDTLAQGATAPTVPDLLAAAGTPGAYGMLAVDTKFPANTPESAKVLTNDQLALVSTAGTATRDWFHDLSPYSQGLLTNVVKGGFRQDLNLYLELPRAADTWPQSPAPAALGPNGKYALSLVDEYDVLAWKNLYNYYHLKERIRLVNGRPQLSAWNGQKGAAPDDLTNPRWNAGVIRPGPVLVRALVFISFGSIPNPTDSTKLIVRFYAQPVLTLWNPYNVDLKIEANQLNYLFTSLPMGQKIYVNGQFKETFTWRGNPSGAVSGANNYTGAAIQPLFAKPTTLLAGEAKMFCPTSYGKATIGIHQHHYMEAVPFTYSASVPGGLWGGGSAGGKVDDQQILQATGLPTDKVKIETFVNLWDQDGGAYLRTYPSTFDIRSEHSDGTDGDYQIYQWGQKLDWRHWSTTPAIASPDKLTKTNKPTASFSEILNAPRPFLVVDVQLKALDEDNLPNKTWRDCIPSHPYMGVAQPSPTGDADVTPYLAGAYKIRFDTINSYQEASSYLQIAPDNPVHTYFGGSYYPAAGASMITDREIPMAPFTSLAQLQHVPQSSVDNLYSSGYHFQNRAIGNSYASPGVPADRVKTNGWPFQVDVYMNGSGGSISGAKFAGDQFHTRPNIDRSYAANNLLWDDYFFSSMAAKNDVLRASSAKKTIDKVVTDFFKNGIALPNERFKPYLGSKTPAAVIARLVRGTAPATNGYKEVASYLTVDGAFNVNSTSVAAWKTMLAAAHQRNVVTMKGANKPTADGAKNFVISRFSMPNGPSDQTAGTAGVNAKWQGYHEVTDAQIGELAEAIVRQVKLRGPFRSLSEFINRRLGPESDERTKFGALEAALEDPKVSINAKYNSPEISTNDIKGNSYQNKAAALGPRYQGSPPYVTQADLLNSMGPVLTARSDTFLIRGYGQACDAKGNVLARAWCEAVVQRVPAYVDPKDANEIAFLSLTSSANKTFGRRFNVSGFRWLSEREI